MECLAKRAQRTLRIVNWNMLICNLDNRLGNTKLPSNHKSDFGDPVRASALPPSTINADVRTLITYIVLDCLYHMCLRSRPRVALPTHHQSRNPGPGLPTAFLMCVRDVCEAWLLIESAVAEFGQMVDFAISVRGSGGYF